MSLSDLYNTIKRLKRDLNSNLWDERTRGGAPHKPILLLSILDEIEGGWLTYHQIASVDHITTTFFEYWTKIFGDSKETTIALPLYHMKSEPFWSLNYTRSVNEFTYSPSLGALLKRIDNFELSEELFELMSDPRESKVLRALILETYFSDETAVKLMNEHQSIQLSFSYSKSVLDIAAEPFTLYHDRETTKIATVEKQIRDKGFSRIIRHHYNHTCSVCGDRVVTPGGRSLADAAHIVPWSKSKNDDPRNGISLCKSHHWIFDQFLLTIDEQYRIRFSKHLTSSNQISSALSQRKGKEIYLPENTLHYPAPEALNYHNEKYEQVQKVWK